jgi:UDP-N-acetylglucosamine 2-epimerase (non-hydrolysing)
MKIMIIVGARPNFMKAAPLLAAIHTHNGGSGALSSVQRPTEEDTIRHVLVHTGQHYDAAMSGSFFADLGLPRPDVYLGVGSGSHAAQTAEIMRRFEEVLLREKPDALVVVGDVNSTVGCALVAAKISFDATGTRPLIAHVEAGLRSFDRRMPEEINRIITDHIADMLFVTEESGVRNLRREGIPDEKIHFVGNTMIDSLVGFQDKADGSIILETLGLRDRADQAGKTNGVRRYALLTLHRPSNVDDRRALKNILAGLGELAGSWPIIFPAHPRTQKRIAEFQLERFFGSDGRPQARNGSTPVPADGGIHLVDPLGYLDFLCLMKHAALVVTDSGGIQEETSCLGIPCVTVRENTERPVTLTSGTNVLAGVTPEGIRRAITQQIHRVPQQNIPEKWDGHAAARILRVLEQALRSKERRVVSASRERSRGMQAGAART